MPERQSLHSTDEREKATACPSHTAGSAQAIAFLLPKEQGWLWDNAGRKGSGNSRISTNIRD